jgi:tetratricopeptide (TPR) repeat protein
MIATDKLETTVSEYFKKYGNYMLTDDETEKMGLSLLFKEVVNVSNLYQSHRLFVYRSCVEVMHRLFIEKELLEDATFEPIEEIFAKVEQTFGTYYLDTQYHNFKLLFNFLKLQYYFHYKIYRKAEAYYEEVNEQLELLLSNFGFYTFPPNFLFLKIQRSHRLEQTDMLYEEAKNVFEDFIPYESDLPLVTYYYSYRSLVAYFNGKYEESAQWIYNLLNQVTYKNHPSALLEVKLLQSLDYCMMKYHDLFSQSVNSIQRQIRMLGDCEHAEIFIKIMKTALGEKKSKDEKITLLVDKFKDTKKPAFCPVAQINMNDNFIKKLANL